MENLCWIMIIINFLNNNKGLFSAINLLATVIIFGGILWLTGKYAKSTEKLALQTVISVKQTEESLKLTKEKEKTDRTLDLLNNFNYTLYDKLTKARFEHKSVEDMYENWGVDVYKFISDFDTISLLYSSGKLNKEIFEAKFEPLFINFDTNFGDKIFEIIYSHKKYNSKYYFQNFLKLIIEILKSEIERNDLMKFQFEGDIAKFNKLIK